MVRPSRFKTKLVSTFLHSSLLACLKTAHTSVMPNTPSASRPRSEARVLAVAHTRVSPLFCMQPGLDAPAFCAEKAWPAVVHDATAIGILPRLGQGGGEYEYSRYVCTCLAPHFVAPCDPASALVCHPTELRPVISVWTAIQSVRDRLHSHGTYCTS